MARLIVAALLARGTISVVQRNAYCGSSKARIFKVQRYLPIMMFQRLEYESSMARIMKVQRHEIY
jgi:hypothetical protein